MEARRRYRRRKCRCCGQWFLPQAHNAYHQRYCTRPGCRSASKRMSHRRWLRKNPDHHRGNANVLRVQAWRAHRPRYCRPRPARRLLIRVRISAFGRLKAQIRIRAEQMKTGALRELNLTQHSPNQPFALVLRCALRDLIGVFPASCYTCRHICARPMPKWRRRRFAPCLA